MDRRSFALSLGVALSELARNGGARHESPGGQLPTVDVRRSGAVGDGRTDDTLAIQRGIDSLPTTGGVVEVPRGAYLIDAVRGLRLRSHITFRMRRGAVLAALPTASTHYAILRGRGLEGVRISGGVLLGERGGHLPPHEGEWGMGIDLRGCARVTIEGVTARECWGDGIYLGHESSAGVPGGECSDITLRRCQAIGNRRQGLSVTGCLGVTIESCSFIGTWGTSPAAGVDLEPNAGKRVEGVTIRDSLFRGNAGWGLLAGGAGVERANVLNSRFVANGLGGIRLVRTRDSVVQGNQIEVSEGPAVLLEGGSTGIVVASNRVKQNGHPITDGRLYVERGGARGNRITP
jgi:polygalacturonase